MPCRVIRRDLDIPRGAARRGSVTRGAYARAVLLGKREIAMELAPQGGGEKEEKRHLPMQQYGDGFGNYLCVHIMVTFVFFGGRCNDVLLACLLRMGGLSGAGIISNV